MTENELKMFLKPYMEKMNAFKRLKEGRELDKAEEIAYHKARINGLKQKNGAMARDIAYNEQNISNIHEKIMCLEEEQRWEEFIKYCNTFC